MRTTLTLEDDVERELRRLSRKTGEPFKRIVNAALRAGLRARRAPPARRYRLNPVSLGGVLPGIDVNHALGLADALEDEALAKRLELRK